MWSVAVNMYILLSGISPFFYEDEDEVLNSVNKVKWAFDPDAFASVTSEAKDFISKCFIKATEMRMTAKQLSSTRGCLKTTPMCARRVLWISKTSCRRLTSVCTLRRKRITCGDRSNFEHSPRRNSSHPRTLTRRNK